VEVVGHGVLVDFADAAFLRANGAREVAEMVDGEGNIGGKGFAHRFAVVPRFRHCELFEVLLDAAGDLVQDVGSLRRRSPCPRGGRGVGCIQR